MASIRTRTYQCPGTYRLPDRTVFMVVFYIVRLGELRLSAIFGTRTSASDRAQVMMSSVPDLNLAFQ
jgi:hypothetical protein